MGPLAPAGSLVAPRLSSAPALSLRSEKRSTISGGASAWCEAALRSPVAMKTCQSAPSEPSAEGVGER
eukprot:9098276-Pyramimonas_sp.AAC.1